MTAPMALSYEEENELRIKREKKLSIMLLVLLGSLYLTNFSFVLSSYVSINYSLISKIIKFMPILATVYALPSLYYSQYDKRFITLIVVLFGFYAWSGIMVFNSHYTEYLKYFITVCLPCMIATYAIEDYNYFLTKLKYVSIVFSFFALYILLVSQNSVDTDSDYFMSYSYSSSIMTMALFNDVPVKKFCKPLVFCGVVIYITSIVLLGARGPLLTILLFLVSKNISSPKRNLAFKAVMVIALGILLMTYEKIFSFLNVLALSHGIKSRTLASFSGETISMSGRENYYSFYLGEIFANPLKFRGIASDWDKMGYPHQIFIELSYQLGAIGIIASIIIIVAIVYMIIKQYRNPFAQTCNIFFLGIGIFTLLLSNSFWKSLQFWMWLGYMFNARKGIANNASIGNQFLQLRQHG